MENELKKQGYAIVEENGKSYLHITKELNDTLQASKVLGGQMVELIMQKHICKIIID